MWISMATASMISSSARRWHKQKPARSSSFSAVAIPEGCSSGPECQSTIARIRSLFPAKESDRGEKGEGAPAHEYAELRPETGETRAIEHQCAERIVERRERQHLDDGLHDVGIT